MDSSPLFDPTYLPVILATLVGFGILAAALLVPVWRFLDREQEVSKDWTEQSLAERMKKKKTSGDGAPASTPSSDDEDAKPSE